MARRCKVCGEEMRYQVGEHYRDTGRGMVLYKDVRLYTCPAGCSGTYYDYRSARPADRPERVFGLIPVPDRVVNVVDPLLSIGLTAMTILIIAGFLASTLPVVAKSLAVVLIVTCAVWLSTIMSDKQEQNGE